MTCRFKAELTVRVDSEDSPVDGGVFFVISLQLSKVQMKTTTKLTLRMYQNENDYWRIREFLREVSFLNDLHDYAWSLVRWDYWLWHVNMNIFHFKLEDVITLWETEGRIVAMLNPDTNGEAFFQVHPAYRSMELFNEMLDIAEIKLPNHKM